MTTSRSLLFVSSLALLSASAVACGGDAKAPKIRSFDAVPDTLPTLGGETTLVWDVKDADSLELLPGIGAVSGTAHTIAISETTEFTLIAKKNGRSTRKKTTVTCVAPGTISGIIRNPVTRTPLPQFAVTAGGQATLTDEEGRFYFSNISTPYDVTIYMTTGAPFFFQYRGLTRFDPVLEFPVSIASSTEIDVSGVVTPTTAAANTVTDLQMKTRTQVIPSFAPVDNGTGAYTANDVYFECVLCPPEPDTVTAIATRFTDTTSPVTYTHFGRASREIDPLDPAPTDFNVTLSPVSNVSTLIEYEPAAPFISYTPIVATLFVDSASGAASDVAYGLPSAAMLVGTNDDIRFSTPDVGGGQLALWTSFGNSSNGSSGIHTVRVTPGATAKAVLPQLPQIATPIDGGVVDRETLFTVLAHENSVKMWQFAGPVLAFIFTTENTVTIPDLSEAGLSFSDGPINVAVVEIYPAPSTDDVASPDGIYGPATEMFGFVQSRSVFLETGDDDEDDGPPPPVP